MISPSDPKQTVTYRLRTRNYLSKISFLSTFAMIACLLIPVFLHAAEGSEIRLDCSDRSRGTIETKIGFAMIIPAQFEKASYDDNQIEWYRHLPGSGPLTPEIRFASIRSETLDNSILDGWSEVEVDHPLARGIGVFRTEYSRDNGPLIKYLAIVRHGNVLLASGYLPIDAESLFECLITVAG